MRPTLLASLALASLVTATGEIANAQAELTAFDVDGDERLEHANFPRGAFVECTRLVHSIRGEATGDQFGWVSSPLPDLNGDGAPEFVVTAPFTGNNRGKIYVYSGATGEQIFRAFGLGAGRRLGWAVRDAGDVNGDGVCDIVAGAPGAGGPNPRGRARVYSGRPQDQGLVIWSVAKGVSADSFGSSVCGIGDVNNDGFDDVAVGAPGDDTFAANAGRVYIISGIDGDTVLWTIDGDAAQAGFGNSVANLGDVNDDGRDDLVVGAPSGGPGARGKAHVIDVVNQTELYSLLPDNTGANFGQFFVATPGDVNADGTPDVYVADFNDSQNGNAAGKAYIFDGTDGSPIWTIAGRTPNDGFGIGRGAGDVNGDGHADLLMCGWIDSAGAPGAGKATVYSGADLSVLQTITSTTANETLGFDAHGIGDVSGDGHPDYVLTAAQNGEVGPLAGMVYVVAGGPPVTSAGEGSAGSGGFVPSLTTPDCPRVGGGVTLTIVDGRGGAQGGLFIGSAPGSFLLGGGTLHLTPDVFVPHTLAGTPDVAGAGGTTVELPVPWEPALFGTTVWLQAGYVDDGAPFGISFSSALALDVTQP